MNFIKRMKTNLNLRTKKKNFGFLILDGEKKFFGLKSAIIKNFPKKKFLVKIRPKSGNPKSRGNTVNQRIIILEK